MSEKEYIKFIQKLELKLFLMEVEEECKED